MGRFILILMLVPLLAGAQVKSFDDSPVYVTDDGSGEYTLLFIHGWNLNHTFWQHQVAYFKDNYRVVTLDLPGYGQSGKDRKSWTIDAFGKDIQSVIEQLDLENVILVAHSMGGNIALEAIDENPEPIIGLIGVDNFKEVGSLPDSATAAQMDAFYAFLEQDYPKHVRSASESFMFSPDSPPGPKEEILSTYADSDADIAIALIKAAYSESSNEMKLLPELEVPFALVSATMIPVNEDSLRSYYHGPFFKNYQVEKSGHFPMYERPGEFNQALEAALTDMGF